MASDEATTWGLAHSQAIYRAMVDPSVQQDGYDVLVHVQVAESLLSEIFKSPSSNAFENLSEGYLETAFSSPESLAEALVNTALFRLINIGWPNVNTGHRAVSLSWDEILDDRDEQLPKDDDGKTIDHRVWTGQDWHIPPIIGFGFDDFLPKSFDLIEQETSGEGSSAWPLVLLCESYAFFVTWRNMGESLHEGDAKYPRHSLDAYTAILDRCIEKDGTGSIGIANHLMQCVSAVVSFQNGNRSMGFSSLEESIFGAPKIEWALGYLDHELQQSSLKKSDLDIHEWIQMFRLTVVSFENTYRSDQAYGVLSPGSVRGLN